MTPEVEAQQLPTPRPSEVAKWIHEATELRDQITRYRELWQKEERPEWYPMLDIAEEQLFHLGIVLDYLYKRVSNGG